MTPTTLVLRMNASGSSNLMANPYVKGRTTFSDYFQWDWIPQQPDGLYSVTVRLKTKWECGVSHSIRIRWSQKQNWYLQTLRKFYRN